MTNTSPTPALADLDNKPIAYAIYGINGAGKHYVHDVRMIEKDDDNEGWKSDDGSLGDYWAGNDALAIARRAAQPVAPVQDVLTPLDYRAQGREEALAIILAQDPENPFADHTNSVFGGEDYSTEWDETALRELLHIGDSKHDAYDRAEAAYWEALGQKEEAHREMLLVQQAPFYKPLTDFLAKHEAWDLMGDLERAATPSPQIAEVAEQDALEQAEKRILANLVPGRTDQLELHWVTHNAATMNAAEIVRAIAASRLVQKESGK